MERLEIPPTLRISNLYEVSKTESLAAAIKGAQSKNNLLGNGKDKSFVGS
ncbi:MAG TPA: hypothetical protein VFF27_07015 [Bacteroidia bacterium]|jgi:hypothetical protein|nr:hypothetical protein [Bacteroidia bacterium]